MTENIYQCVSCHYTTLDLVQLTDHMDTGEHDYLMMCAFTYDLKSRPVHRYFTVKHMLNPTVGSDPILASGETKNT